MLIVGAACIVVSAILTHVLSKKLVTKENILKLIGGFAAGSGCFLITAGIEMPDWAKYTCVVIAVILGVMFVKGNEANIFCYGTGFIGAFMMMHGLGQYLKGFPAFSTNGVEEQKLSNAFLGYLAGIVIFTIVGGRIQLKKISESEGDFMGSDTM